MLYKLKIAEIKSSDRIGIKNPTDFGLKEKDIENFLKSRLAEIVSEDQLMLIGQERQFQEEPDLLALDKEGILYIFELKRWQSNPENLLQVMRYGQIFGRHTYPELEDLARRQLNTNNSWNLAEQHKTHFELAKSLSESEFNQEQVFVLVTNGMDGNTISAVNYWSQKGVRIECSPYRIYEINGEPYIQFDTYNPDDEVLVEENTEFFIVNTCKTYIPDAWKDMLGNNKAATYGGRKWAVRQISKSSQVYLYHNVDGVIAKGVATSTYQEDDDNSEEFYVPLEMEWKLEDEDKWEAKAPKARDINQKMNTGHRFRQSAFSISEQMAKAIDEIAKEKGATG